jgi:hypothetical protein
MPAAEPYTTSKWPLTEEEYGLAHFTMLLGVVFLVLLLDAARRSITHLLSPPKDGAAPGVSSNEVQLKFLVWSRLQGEMTVLATLPIMSWMATRTGLLDVLAETARRWPRVEIYLSISDVHAPASLANASAIPMQTSLSCHPRMPPDAETLLYLLNDVIFALLVAMFLYFAFIAIALQAMQQWLAIYQRLETGGQPRNPTETLASRQLDAMRVQLLDACSTLSRDKLERDTALKKTVESSCLYVSYYLSQVYHAQLKTLTDFTPSSWAILMVYFGTLGGALFFCAPWRALTLLADWLWYGTSVYLSYRLIYHNFILRKMERDRWREGTPDDG